MAALQSLDGYQATTVVAPGILSGTTDVRTGSDRIATFWPGADQAAHVRLFLASPMLLEACKATLLLAGGEDLPDNGEYSGAAITDLVRAAVAQAQGQTS